jgi:hypothetical protein
MLNKWTSHWEYTGWYRPLQWIKNVHMYFFAAVATIFLILFSATIAIGAWDIEAGMYAFRSSLKGLQE